MTGLKHDFLTKGKYVHLIKPKLVTRH